MGLLGFRQERVDVHVADCAAGGNEDAVEEAGVDLEQPAHLADDVLPAAAVAVLDVVEPPEERPHDLVIVAEEARSAQIALSTTRQHVDHAGQGARRVRGRPPHRLRGCLPPAGNARFREIGHEIRSSGVETSKSRASTGFGSNIAPLTRGGPRNVARQLPQAPSLPGDAGAARPQPPPAPLGPALRDPEAPRDRAPLRLPAGVEGRELSWAVPKGPSLDPSVKRMAMPTEDHPIEYNKFEGVIPEGEYGGGTVMIWDRGTWTPETEDVDDGLKKGEPKFRLDGEKLHGSWVLVRTRRAGEKRPAWLLIKHRDDGASKRDIADEEPRSVVSRRLLVEIARDEGGNMEKAADGDPPALLRRMLESPELVMPASRRRKKSVWHSNRRPAPQRSRRRSAPERKRPGKPGAPEREPETFDPTARADRFRRCGFRRTRAPILQAPQPRSCPATLTILL